MATVLNRTTKQLIASANTPDYPVQDWIINPDLAAVNGQPSKYWVITDDVVTLADQTARDAVDNALVAAARDAIAAQMDQAENYLRAFALIMLDEINLHATRVNAQKAAVIEGATLAAIKTDFESIPDIPERTVEQLKTALRNKLGT